LEVRPSHTAAWRAAGECLAQQGRLAEAIAALERAVALERFNAGLQHQLAELLVQNGETQRAVMPLQIALILQPDKLVFRQLAAACGMEAMAA
jgi:predicted Zn-dependent protease